jgi:thymidylate synthase (FAD)
MTQVLDHGYVRLVESWGSDERVIEAARMSTNKGFLGWGGICAGCGGTGEQQPHAVMGHADGPCESCKGSGTIVGDEKLLRYLYENKHHTPFEMAGMTIEVQAPIFVFREWHRHRTQSYNEMSSRYVPLPDVNYVPSIERLMRNAGGTNKQAGTVVGAVEMTQQTAEWFQDRLRLLYDEAERIYQAALKNGVPKELARIHLPVGRYSRMRASANLRNWLAFLTLRMDPAAQWEIREYANEVAAHVRLAFPRTYELFAREA